MIRTWHGDRFVGWYINFEQPWRRTPVGFDSRDDVLDVVADGELTTTALKDEDELDFAVRSGHISALDALSIKRTAESVQEDIAQRRWPFNEAAWIGLALPLGLPPVELPPHWEQP